MLELKIIVDQRERNSELINRLEANGAGVELKTIPVGDYIVSDRVCIERKTVADFESSIISGRLFEQLDRLRDGYDSPILIIEGDREDFRLGKNVINGTIAAVCIEYRLSVLFSRGPEDTADIIYSMAKREQEGEARVPSLKGAFRARTSAQFREFVVGNLPGVGPKLAKALLGHFGTIRNIAIASIDELMEVDKIGKKKAETIHLILNGEYGDGGSD